MNTKQHTALILKEQLRKSIKSPARRKDFKLKGAHNAGFGYWFPEHIKYRGEHQDYYSEEFADFVTFIINNLEEIIGEN